jgi:hypothetical protein
MNNTKYACLEELLMSVGYSVARRHANISSSRAVSFLFLYKLLDIATWIKSETPLVVTTPRGNVPEINIPVSVACHVIYNIYSSNLGLGSVHLKLL